MTDVPKGQRLLILQLLAQNGELSGADMVKLDNTLPRSTIYVTLQRLEQQGLLKSKKDKTCPVPGSPHRYFQLTDYGERVLDAAEAFASATQ